MDDIRAESRQRTYRWSDPRAGFAEGRQLSGLDYLTRIMRGELPPAPMAVTLGFRLSAVGDGFATFVCEPGEFLFNPIGSVHGGLAATLIDSATGCAVHTQLSAGTFYTTVNLSVDFIKAVSEQAGLLTCEGRVVRAGARIAVADAEVKGGDGVLYARGSATCLILRPERAR
jgi:uncharacterized protein (TIGR00369 family)